jgi:(E)-4-hydroxy-3-methylbut-2-enyl-diphosphate synthase
MVGTVGVGGANPIRVQSMTTSDTQDVAATVRQSIALAEVGCEIVRITAPNVAAARCLKEIRAQISAAGFGQVPLVADIHFLPSAAMEAVEHVEKIRVNPGNYADKKKFAVMEYTDQAYEEELQRIHDSFSPLVIRCRELGRAMRIGTNHGSLSDRIMNRYGDTPLGMVESALEFLRICQSHHYRDIILSMKASNPKVMIEAYRLLVSRMQDEDMHYPLHLGVTEAGDGEDGRIKSAIGIGSLLMDGLGDTIRVSLTEDSVYEVPVAQALAQKAMSQWAGLGAPGVSASPSAGPAASEARSDSIDPFHFSRRLTAPIALAPKLGAGGENLPRVIVRATPEELGNPHSPLRHPRREDTPAEGVLLAISQRADLAAALNAAAHAAGVTQFIVLELAPELTPDSLAVSAEGGARPPGAPAGAPVPVAILRRFAGGDAPLLGQFAAAARRAQYSLICDIAPADVAVLAPTLRAAAVPLIVTWSGAAAATGTAGQFHPAGQYRQLTEALKTAGLAVPIWIRSTAHTAVQGGNSFLSRLLEASILAGSLLCDGVGDLLSVETEPDLDRSIRLAYNVLQGAGARVSKTEFVACPSCGRTLFDLQTTTQRIRAQTGHLKGVKIAIMGCIVNGPGEMADADFGYVGGAPGKINLYVGKQCVQYNLPQAEADGRLIALIKEHGRWLEPTYSKS